MQQLWYDEYVTYVDILQYDLVSGPDRKLVQDYHKLTVKILHNKLD